MTDAVPTPAPIGGDASPISPAAAGTQPSAPGAITEDLVKLALRRVKDPEVNLNIVDMGLIYDVRIAGSDVTVDMSLTTPACPSGPQIMSEAEEQLRSGTWSTIRYAKRQNKPTTIIFPDGSVIEHFERNAL